MGSSDNDMCPNWHDSMLRKPRGKSMWLAFGSRAGAREVGSSRMVRVGGVKSNGRRVGRREGKIMSLFQGRCVSRACLWCGSRKNT